MWIGCLTCYCVPVKPIADFLQLFSLVLAEHLYGQFNRVNLGDALASHHSDKRVFEP